MNRYNQVPHLTQDTNVNHFSRSKEEADTLLMQVKMAQQDGHFFTGHRCICPLPKKTTRISEADYFRDMYLEQTEEIST